MNARTWVNGEMRDGLPVTDRGLQYGDGVFETMAICEGRLPLLDRHMARLGRGIGRLGIALPPALDLAAEVASRVSSVRQGVAKLIITRGSSGRGYQLPPRSMPNWILTLSEWPEHYAGVLAQGAHLRLCRQTLAIQPSLAGIKHLNRLEQVLARAEWSEPDIVEGLMQDTAGNLVCGTMSNIFVALGDGIVTPSVDQCGVRGVMREVLMDHARTQGISVQERPLSLEQALGADELFVTNALFGIWPVRQFEQRAYPRMDVARRFRVQLARAGISQCLDP